MWINCGQMLLICHEKLAEICKKYGIALKPCAALGLLNALEQ